MIALSRRLPAFAAACVAAACAPAGPRMHPPDHVEPYCGGRIAQVSSIESVVTSAEDRMSPAPVLTAKALRRAVAATGGAIAHWNDQPLPMPQVAKALGYPDKYVTLGDAVVFNREGSADTRRLYLTVKLPHGEKTFATRAFDVQDICNEGTKSM